MPFFATFYSNFSHDKYALNYQDEDDDMHLYYDYTNVEQGSQSRVIKVSLSKRAHHFVVTFLVVVRGALKRMLGVTWVLGGVGEYLIFVCGGILGCVFIT